MPPSRIAPASWLSKSTRPGACPGFLALAMLLAVTSWRMLTPSSAIRMSEPVSPVNALVSMSAFSVCSLDDQVGVQRTGRLDALQDRDHVARVGLDAAERLHQV